MMKFVLKPFLFFWVLFALTSVAQSQIKPDQKYTGYYKGTVQKGCPFALTITSKGDGYRYALQFKDKVRSGRLKISNINGEVYLTFVGLVARKPHMEVEGQLMGQTVVIQNEGNAMNQYTLFGECDAKYIELLKVNKK